MPARMGGQSQTVGLPPGSLVHIGEHFGDNSRVSILEYNENEYQEQQFDITEEWTPSSNDAAVTWVNIVGIHDINLLEKCGKQFHLHMLVLEDILNTRQRPKFEDYGEYFFIILKHISNREIRTKVDIDQISMIVGKNFLITFEERESDVFHSIRDRIINGKGLIRKMGADFLAYSLLDTVIDNYFIVLETMGEKIEELEEILIAQPTRETIHAIYRLKREMLLLRKSIWPLREVIGNMEKGVTPVIQSTTLIYLRDVYDHIIEMVDMIETFRDMLSGMLDIYLSSVSNRMNEVMKVLTVISTIFIPLTFIVGVYGMNFKFMPELEWYWGYPAVIGFMLGISVFMLIYFRRKRWL